MNKLNSQNSSIAFGKIEVYLLIIYFMGTDSICITVMSDLFISI